MRRACWRCTSFGTSPLFGDMTAGRWLTDYIGHEVRRHQYVLEALLADQQWQRWERGVASGGGTVWRHGCRHRASRDGFMACPDTGCGAAPPTSSAHRSICAEHLSFTRECFGLPRALARVPAWDTLQVRPCRLWRGIHAAQGPTPEPAQAAPVVVGCWKKSRGPAGLQGAEPNGDDRVVDLIRPGTGPNQVRHAALAYGFDSACSCSMITLARVA
ncbi:UNVERIFIED_ORG: hypothetical protein GGR68_003313 [Xanthomonas campestris]